MVPTILLLVVAALVLAAVAVMRVYRFRSGHEPHPSGWRGYTLLVVLLFVPPLILENIVPTSTKAGQMDGATTIFVYILLLAALWAIMRFAGPIIARLAPDHWRPLVLLALTGSEPTRVVPKEPALAGAMAQQVALVDERNADFPRGAAFMYQVDLPGFQSNWDALDSATQTLETSIGDAHRSGLGVAQRAVDTATDARGRLDVLRRDAAAHGQAWAV